MIHTGWNVFSSRISNQIRVLFQIKEEPAKTCKNYFMETDLQLLVFFAKNEGNNYDHLKREKISCLQLKISL